MQTDPNWTNFLWNPKTRQVCFIHALPQKGYNGIIINSLFKDWIGRFWSYKDFFKRIHGQMAFSPPICSDWRSWSMYWVEPEVGLSYRRRKSGQSPQYNFASPFLGTYIWVPWLLRSCLTPMLILWLFLPLHSNLKLYNHFLSGKGRNGQISPTKFVQRYLWCWVIVWHRHLERLIVWIGMF